MESDLFVKLFKKLSKCQVIPFSDETYHTLMDMKPDDWIMINNKLQAKGYHIVYNCIDDCFVVH